MRLESVLTELWPYELNHFRHFLQCRVWSLCNQLLLQFSIDVSQTWQTYCAYIEYVFAEETLSQTLELSLFLFQGF